MRPAIAIAIPMLLIVLGVLVLIGCITVPATRQLQPNLQPKPEFAIGTSPDKPIQLGKTHIDDAFIILSHKVQARGANQNWTDLAQLGQKYPAALLAHWGVSDDGREFWVRYEIRTSTEVWPLCFQAITHTESQDLILDVNSDGIVTAEHTSNQPPVRGMTNPMRWREVFDEATRSKLRDAGVFPSEAFLDRYIAATQQFEQRRRQRAAQRLASPSTQEHRP